MLNGYTNKPRVIIKSIGTRRAKKIRPAKFNAHVLLHCVAFYVTWCLTQSQNANPNARRQLVVNISGIHRF